MSEPFEKHPRGDPVRPQWEAAGQQRSDSSTLDGPSAGGANPSTLNYASANGYPRPPAPTSISKEAQFILGVFSLPAIFVVGFGATLLTQFLLLLTYHGIKDDTWWATFGIGCLIGLVAVVVIRLKTGWSTYLPAFMIASGVAVLIVGCPFVALVAVCGGFRL